MSSAATPESMISPSAPNRRRSRRLTKSCPNMDSRKRAPKRSAQDVELVLHTLSDDKMDILKDCATLSLKDFKWDLSLFEIMIAFEKRAIIRRVRGSIYTLTFKAMGHGHELTLEAVVCDTLFLRKVIHYRTLTPKLGEWIPGTYCIPNHPDHKQILGSLARFAFLFPPINLVPPFEPTIPNPPPALPIVNVPARSAPFKLGRSHWKKAMEAQERAKKSGKENNQASKKSCESSEAGKAFLSRIRKLASTTGSTLPVELELDKLSHEMRVSLEECASLALLDHNIRNVRYGDFRFVKIEKAIARRTCGYIYTLTFQAVSDKYGEATFEAIVWDPNGKRRVNRFRHIRPRHGKWNHGTLCVPKY